MFWSSEFKRHHIWNDQDRIACSYYLLVQFPFWLLVPGYESLQLMHSLSCFRILPNLAESSLSDLNALYHASLMSASTKDC